MGEVLKDWIQPRTVHVAECACGKREIWKFSNPPTEVLCACGKWLTYQAISYVGPPIEQRGKISGTFPKFGKSHEISQPTICNDKSGDDK